MSNLIRTQQFWTLLIGLVFALVATLAPATQPYLDTLLPTLVLLILAALGAETAAPAIEAYAVRANAQARLAESQIVK